jgi:type I restriction enzyme, S subunit
MSQYPPSINAGTPRIESFPKSWLRKKFSDVLEPTMRPITLEPMTKYQLVVAKRNRGGIAPREVLLGKDILTPGQYILRSGDFVIAKRQISHGACGFVPPELDGAIVSGEYDVFRVKGDLQPDFLSLLTHSPYFQQTTFHSSIGVAVEKLIFKTERWLRRPIAIPANDYQLKSIRLMKAIDNHLAQLTALVDAKREFKRGLMNDLLTGRRRFPGFEGKWKKVKLGDVAEITMGSSPPSEAYNTSNIGLPLLQGMSDVNNNISAPRLFTSEITRVIEAGDIALAVRAPVGKPIKVNEKTCIGRGFCGLKINDYETDFIWHSLIYHEADWGRVSQGSTFEAVTGKDVRKFELSIPMEKLEQTSILLLLNKVDEESGLITELIEHTKIHKQSLMQGLLTKENQK